MRVKQSLLILLVVYLLTVLMTGLVSGATDNSRPLPPTESDAGKSVGPTLNHFPVSESALMKPPSSIDTFNAEFKLEVFRYGNRKSKTVYLTFDDGPDPEYTPRVLAILRKHHIQATFFLLGINAKKHPQLVQAIHADGHILGNHTFHHRSLKNLSTDQIVEEMDRAQQVIKQATGITPQLFRPPYGILTDQVLLAADKKHLKIAMWSVDPEDYLQHNQNKLVHQIQHHLDDGSIILLHDNSENTIRSLESIIDMTTKKNFTFSGLDATLTGESASYYFSKSYLSGKLPQVKKDIPKKPEIATLQSDRVFVIKVSEDLNLLETIANTCATYKIAYAKITISGKLTKTVLSYPKNKPKPREKTLNKPLWLITGTGIFQEKTETPFRISACLIDENNNVMGGIIAPGTLMSQGDIIIQNYKPK